MTQDCIKLAKAGLPAVVLAADFFKEEIRHIAAGKGMPALRRYIFPRRFEVLPAEELRSNVASAVATLVDMLTTPRDGEVVQ